jgi:hypothetical protein
MKCVLIVPVIHLCKCNKVHTLLHPCWRVANWSHGLVLYWSPSLIKRENVSHGVYCLIICTSSHFVTQNINDTVHNPLHNIFVYPRMSTFPINRFPSVHSLLHRDYVEFKTHGPLTNNISCCHYFITLNLINLLQFCYGWFNLPVIFLEIYGKLQNDCKILYLLRVL